MTAQERLLGVRAKIERSKQHIHDLERLVGLFRKTNPYRVVADSHSQPGHTSFVLKKYSDPAVDLPIVAGEAIHQLRSSLDHLAWQLVEANNGTPSRRTYFPIYQIAPTKTEDKKSFAAKVKGMSAQAISRIESLQPYNGGNTLWMLDELNNFDKHRLVFVVAWQAADASITLTQGPRTGQSAFMTFAMPGILEDGAEIGSVSGSLLPTTHQYFDVSVDIAFGQPQIVKGQPVLPFLHQMAGFVDGVVNQFVPFL